MALTQVIQPKKRLLVSEDCNPHNVCAYCRVSTDDKDQRNSLVSQQKFFSSYFINHPNWYNVGIFADEGLSGTSLEKREQFNEMLRLARCGKVDLIITKEVSRFSRNVQDILNIVEELRNRSVYIWFLSDDINTERPDYREKLTIAGNSAEQESLRTSRRVRWGQRQQMERGKVFGRREMFGYKIETDNLNQQHFVIVPEEAEIIKQIFLWYVNGDGTHRIARRLEQLGITTKHYTKGWTNTTILRILRNEKYVGDLIQGKTYTPDPLKHKKKYNRGESCIFYTKDHHADAAIIDRELWEQVQAILQAAAPSETTKYKYSNRYWASGKICCGCCGARYVSIQKKQKTTPYKAWVCSNNNQYGSRRNEGGNAAGFTRSGCPGKRVNDRVLQAAVYDILTEFIAAYKQRIVQESLSFSRCAEYTSTINNKCLDVEQRIKKLRQKTTQLTVKLMDGVIPETVYTNVVGILCAEIRQLETTRFQYQDNVVFQTQEGAESTIIKRIESIVNLQDKTINEEIYERVTQKIIVYPENVLELHLSFLTEPINLRYQTTGKADTFQAEFTILSMTGCTLS